MVASVAGGVKPASIIDIEQRFYRQLIAGQQREQGSMPLAAELEELVFKLEVEREAAMQRLEKKQQAQALIDNIRNQLVKTLLGELDNHIAMPQLFLKDSAISNKQLLLLELISSPQLDLNRLRPVVADIPWLGRDLITIVNSPAFVAKRPQGSDIQVNDLKLVLNYIGMEQLRLYIPYYLCRHWLSANPSLVWVNRKVWRYLQLQAVAARALAQLHQQDGILLYSVALMQQLGMSLLLGVAANIYERLRHTWRREAMAQRDGELHDAVSVCQFPLEQLWPIIAAHSANLCWQVPSALGFADAAPIKLLRERASSVAFSSLSDAAKILDKSACYAKCLLLEELQQLSFSDKKLLFTYYELSEQEQIRLSGQNFRKTEPV
ncbi:HDOD domain-containing protein [Shewanella sp. A3A]|nr:HDOD domain-containing protein [Shewanella ferrihydritica]